MSYRTAKQETERLICEIEEMTITHRAYTAECLRRVLKENEELKERIREHTLLISPYYVKENFISVQKVKDMIEEIDEKIKREENEKVVIYLHKQRNILQELLEGKK